MDNRFVIVAGYGWSGSSVVIDLLKEFENTFDPNIEFRLIKDPYGIYELEQALVSSWDYINSNIAIKDYIWLCKKCSKTNTPFSPLGLGYESKLNKDFMKLTDSYVSSLCKFTYHGNSIISKFKRPYITYLRKRYLDILYRRTKGKIGSFDFGDLTYFSKMDSSSFLSATQDYLERVFLPYFKDNKIVILDQAISPVHIECLKYFKNAKLIVVDRNPTDIYVDLIKSKGLIGAELADTHDANMYVEWHKSIRTDMVNQENVLYMSFEDLVLDYESSKEKIVKFLKWDLGEHINQYKYFDPEKSKANIGFGICDECSQNEYQFISDNLLK